VDRAVGGVYQERISRSLTLCDRIFYGLGKVALARAWRPLAIKGRSRQSKRQLGFCCRSIGGDCDDSWIVGQPEVGCFWGQLLCCPSSALNLGPASTAPS
jgi:hypothetical protein